MILKSGTMITWTGIINPLSSRKKIAVRNRNRNCASAKPASDETASTSPTPMMVTMVEFTK